MGVSRSPLCRNTLLRGGQQRMKEVAGVKPDGGNRQARAFVPGCGCPPPVQSQRMNPLAHILGMMVCAAVVVWCVLAWRRGREKRRRWNLTLCPECGYDLRESKDR